VPVYLFIDFYEFIIAAQGVKQNGTIRRPNVGNRTIRLPGPLWRFVACSTACRPCVLFHAISRRAALSS
jgi:hypothetical protein